MYRKISICMIALLIMIAIGCTKSDGTIGIVYGDKNAPIEVVNYSSFQCISCAEMHNEIGKTIQQYIKSGDIKYIEKQIDIKRFEYDDVIYKYMNEKQVNDFEELSKIYKKQNEWITMKSAEEVIEFLELETRENQKHIKDIEKVNEEKMELEIKEVPTMFINGEIVPAGITKEEFKLKIELLLNKG